MTPPARATWCIRGGNIDDDIISINAKLANTDDEISCRVFTGLVLS